MVHTGAWMRGLGAIALVVMTAGAHAQTGACCLQDTGACITATQADCNGPIMGQWLGTGLSCADDLPCSTSYGACCTPDECVTTPMFVCSLIPESSFAGVGVACHETMYTLTGLPPASAIDMTGASTLTFIDDNSGFGVNDEGMSAYTLPVDFTYQGVTYAAGTTLNVHTNGFVSFDVIDVTNRPDTLNFHLEFGPDASTPNAAICPLWSDQASVVVRQRNVVAGGTTTMVFEWDTAPFNTERWGGRYQLHLISSNSPSLDGTIRFVYIDAPGTLFDSTTSLDERVFIGAHSTGGLSVYRPDLAMIRDMVTNQGFQGVELKPDTTMGPCLMNVCAADFDLDGDVDLTDFGTFGAAFGSMVGDANYSASADFDSDDDVDLTDFGTFGAQFGRTDCLQ